MRPLLERTLSGPKPPQKKNRRATHALLSPFIMHDAQSDEMTVTARPRELGAPANSNIFQS